MAVNPVRWHVGGTGSVMESFSPVLSIPPLFPVQNLRNYFLSGLFQSVNAQNLKPLVLATICKSGGNMPQKCCLHMDAALTEKSSWTIGS